MANLLPMPFISYVLPQTVNTDLDTAWLGVNGGFVYPDTRSLTRRNGVTIPVIHELWHQRCF